MSDIGRGRPRSIKPDVHGDSTESDALIGRCRAMQEVYKNIGRLANLPDAVLIEGEVRTGKEMIARALNSYGSRQQAE